MLSPPLGLHSAPTHFLSGLPMLQASASWYPLCSKLQCWLRANFLGSSTQEINCGSTHCLTLTLNLSANLGEPLTLEFPCLQNQPHVESTRFCWQPEGKPGPSDPGQSSFHVAVWLKHGKNFSGCRSSMRYPPSFLFSGTVSLNKSVFSFSALEPWMGRVSLSRPQSY